MKSVKLPSLDTKILRIDPGILQENKLDIIVDVLRRDGIIIYPTDTFYGLGGAYGSMKAQEKVFRLKEREPDKPLPVVISDLVMLETLELEIPPVFAILSSVFWPGPLTLVFRRLRTGGIGHFEDQNSLAVRMPGHEWLRTLVSRACFPLTASSANISGQPEISDGRDAITAFEGKVDLIVDAGRTAGGLPSTVLDLRPERPVIIREGAVSASELRGFLL